MRADRDDIRHNQNLWAEDLARMIHTGSRRNRRDAKQDGRAEPGGREADLTQSVDRSSGEPARRQACRSGRSAGAVEAVVNNAGRLAPRSYTASPGAKGR
ncbi:protein of unknown function [Nitrospira defluvii]|uniref:Uncharacterized protein n=1 Tax=Nitrospira defluvii TaxID=330214 RepID=D8P9L7_9BACT|nr:protein of unknown function [Nitrospira defluvii]